MTAHSPSAWRRLEGGVWMSHNHPERPTGNGWEPLYTGPVLPEIQARAIAIADACMRSDIECYGVQIGGLLSGDYGLTNPDQGEVSTLVAASEELLEAFEYLRDRGLAELRAVNGVEHIHLFTDRFAE